MSNQSRAVKQAHDAQLIVGVEKDLQNVASLLLAGEAFTPKSLQALLQSRIDAANAVVTARAHWLDTVKTFKAIDVKGTVVVRGLHQYLVNAYGAASPLLADFGFTPSKRATQTPEQKAAAVAKRAATRKARNTLGKKAKLAIKGTALPTAPATPAPLSAPVTVPTAPVHPAVAPTTEVTVTKS